MIAQPRWTLIVLGFTFLSTITMAYRVDNRSAPLQKQQHILPVGLFIGAIEEGARIFTPTRLLPFEHPDSEGHEYPTALQLHQSEYEALVWLGEQIGFKLAATLQRYPKLPAQQWWYEEFEEMPVEEIKEAAIHRMKSGASPIPGLRGVVFYEGQATCFIVDTRGLTLEERGMSRATTMGLDVTRAQFLAGLEEIGGSLQAERVWVVAFED